jgi:hypothetical protein
MAIATDIETYSAMLAGLEDLGLSRADIAKQGGMAEVTVWRYINCEVRTPNIIIASRIERLAEKYAVISDQK